MIWLAPIQNEVKIMCSKYEIHSSWTPHDYLFNFWFNIFVLLMLSSYYIFWLVPFRFLRLEFKIFFVHILHSEWIIRKRVYLLEKEIGSIAGSFFRFSRHNQFAIFFLFCAEMPQRCRMWNGFLFQTNWGF